MAKGRSKRGEEKLDVFTFGRKLLEAKDLDPVYALLWDWGTDGTAVQYRWLMAYWCFYDVGTASWIADQKDYWPAMERAAGSKAFPRGAERRHFRGANALESVDWLEKYSEGDPFNLLHPILGSELTALQVVKHVKMWRGFGPWVAFKVADMLESVLFCEVDFSDAHDLVFDAPREGAEAMWDWYNPGIDHEREPGGVVKWAIDGILGPLGWMLAPPRYKRPLGLQEAETILCKWKSYLNGHYSIGDDIRHCRDSLLRFARVRTCQQLLKAGKRGGLW